MRSNDEQAVPPDQGEPTGGRARRRLEEEMASRFGVTPDPDASGRPTDEDPGAGDEPARPAEPDESDR
jgi:hypothetical protein